MATYSNLSYGSRGDEVKKLQQSLISAGYDLGSSGADGIFGAKTQEAVKKYQQANGLAVDGIAGNNTLGKLFSTSSTSTGTTTPAQTQTAPEVPDYSKQVYDPAADTAYQQALAALQQASKNTPTYAGTYDAQLNELYEQIINRDKFKYDLNSDMLYQQYKDQYVNLGQMAMKDTMGQAAALTGGYGSSYGQSVGQQQYDAYLQQLNDVVPELYGMAYGQYQDEGNLMLQQYGMLGDMADDEYGKYQDSLNQYWMNVDYLKGQADDAYDKGYTDWSTKYQAQQEAYDKLLDMMTSSGYKPTASELAAAGMTQAQADNYLKAWKASNPDLAYRTGAITPEEYYSYTGAYPKGYTPPKSPSAPATDPNPQGPPDDGDSGDKPKNAPRYNAATADIQQMLIDAGYNIKKDGVMGPETQKALAAYNNAQEQKSSAGKLTYSDVAMTAAQLKAQGATPNEINTYIYEAVKSASYVPTSSAMKDLNELRSGYVGSTR